MRIIGGRLRGRLLIEPTPQIKKFLRPMREAVRAALFDILGDSVTDARFLDLFAGTGSIGIEALSRGARSCVFVDSSERACQIIRENLKNLGLERCASVYRLDALKAIELFARQGEKFDLVFLGPPYGQELAHKTLAQLAAHPLCSPGALVVTEIFKKEKVQTEYGDLKSFAVRTYGDNSLWFYRWEVLQ
uniref:N6-adenine-specific methylase n=1 Tax=Acetithermum autotrophicum TaxID=1446466 RepID=H5SR19_ACEAU|nr:N6-adenine-specific methylase [Candidatus Acetothermum autotrophicum]